MVWNNGILSSENNTQKGMLGILRSVKSKLDQVNSANFLFEFRSLFFLFQSVIESEDCDNCGKYSITLETFHIIGNA